MSLLVAGRQEEDSGSFALFWDVHGYPVALVTADSNAPDPPMPLGGRFPLHLLALQWVVQYPVIGIGKGAVAPLISVKRICFRPVSDGLSHSGT